MTTDRPYRKALTPQDGSKAELKRASGTQLDPR
jgi:HD-GYP domain-containing protein (c-di-GMP phosphodiesterase class II)